MEFARIILGWGLVALVSCATVPGAGGASAASGPNLTVLNWAGHDGALSYTFDDGQPSQISHWPELKATGVPLTFYLVSSWNGPAQFDATWKDALASWSELGNHTASHKQGAQYQGKDDLIGDVSDCEDYLKGPLGQNEAHSFAYPFGDLRWRTALGGRFLFARSVAAGVVAPLDTTDPLALPVYMADGSETQSDLDRLTDAAQEGGQWRIFLFHSLLPGPNWYAGVPATAVTGNIVRARDQGRLWIDTLENVGAYWLGQRIFSEVTPVTEGRQTTWSWTLPPGFPHGGSLVVTISGGVLTQGNATLEPDPQGRYHVDLDAGTLAWASTEPIE